MGKDSAYVKESSEWLQMFTANAVENVRVVAVLLLELIVLGSPTENL